MLVCVLASGSEGNSTYIETDDVKMLIDLGMNTKYIKDRLAELDVSPDEIGYILMTHAHSDHTGALSTFLKKYSIGGQGWIRTSVAVKRQIYSLFPLTTRAPTHLGCGKRT